MELAPKGAKPAAIGCCAFIIIIILSLFLSWISVSSTVTQVFDKVDVYVDHEIDNLKDELDGYNLSSKTEDRLLESAKTLRDGGLSPVEAMIITMSAKAVMKELGENDPDYLAQERNSSSLLGMTVVAGVFAVLVILIIVQSVLIAFRVLRGKSGVAAAVSNTIFIFLLLLVFIGLEALLNNDASGQFLFSAIGVSKPFTLTLYPPLALALSIGVIVMSAKCREKKKADDRLFDSPYVAPPAPENELYTRYTVPNGCKYVPNSYVGDDEEEDE